MCIAAAGDDARGGRHEGSMAIQGHPGQGPSLRPGSPGGDAWMAAGAHRELHVVLGVGLDCAAWLLAAVRTPVPALRPQCGSSASAVASASQMSRRQEALSAVRPLALAGVELPRFRGHLPGGDLSGRQCLNLAGCHVESRSSGWLPISTRIGFESLILEPSSRAIPETGLPNRSLLFEARVEDQLQGAPLRETLSQPRLAW